MLVPFATGFGTGFTLILAIGAQNAFVLRQGLLRRHVFWICFACALSDAILITAGVAGMGTIAAAAPWLIDALTWGGAAFLIVYGALSLRRALTPGALRAAGQGAQSLGAALAMTFAFTWLNPHVWLDTVGLVGAVSTGFRGDAAKAAFAAGAVAASFVFFFGLGYGARLLAPVFARPRAWAVLDTVIALVMWTIAASLVLG
ncbi:MAG TPA: LysE/ArgO family amino acid transporter [Paracoccaceae bacterium]|nr:LysE/ArgO family amino acid transporter [Paracoccaceae bacterium]